jgi:hypothetical protein
MGKAVTQRTLGAFYARGALGTVGISSQVGKGPEDYNIATEETPALL